MRTRQTVATSVLLLVLLGVAGAVQSFAPQSRVATSPEVGFTSLSPRGASGGAIVPASCESGYEHRTGVCGSEFLFTADSYTVAYNTGTTLRWSLTWNAGAYVWYCEAAGGPWGGVKAIPSGAEGTAALTAATTYTLLCHFFANNNLDTFFSESKSVTINANPPNACYPSADPAGYGSACSSSANACGQTQANGTIQCNSSCSSTPPANPAGYGSSCTSAPNACGQTNSGTIQCNGSCSAGTPSNATCAPTVIFSASPTTINQGQSSTLSWSSTNATSCTSYGGFSTGSATSGTVSVSPSATSNYQIYCVGAGGTVNSTIVTVTVRIPTVSISASPARVTSGGSTTISSTVTNAGSCTITKNGTSWQTFTANPSGTVTKSYSDTNITSQTAYKITCTNSASSVTATAEQILNLLTDFEEF
ncbi:MAG: hypothetical protein WC814_02265 [Candidatus Paceibacterota bacterium]